MSLNREGIEQLKADLMANAIHYNQQNFGTVTKECGTEACLAGMCLMRKVGLPTFTRKVKTANHANLMKQCLDAAVEQLGIEMLEDHEYDAIFENEDGDGLPPIFSRYFCWPDDLRDRFEIAYQDHNHVEMAKIACEALDRMDVNGFVSGRYSSRHEED